MKLRLFNDSVRVRVRRPDVRTLMESGRVEHEVVVGPEAADRLTYSLALGNVWRLEPHRAGLSVTIPREDAEAWADSGRIGLGFTAPWGTRVLVEKDFPCMEPRPDEADEGTYPRAVGMPGSCPADG
jgi:hypothetical protein